LNREIKLGLSTLGDESCRHFAKAQELYLQKHYLLPLAFPLSYAVTRKAKVTGILQGARNIDPQNIFISG
jgi:hypothetical protein